MDRQPDSWQVDVPSESSDYYYEVLIGLPKGGGSQLHKECECPAFAEYGDCKHVTAAILYLQDVVDKFEEEEDGFDYFEDPEKKESTAKAPSANPTAQKGFYSFRMETISRWTLSGLAGNPDPRAFYLLASRVEILDKSSAHNTFRFRESARDIYNIDIIYDGVGGFSTRCTCSITSTPICTHIFGAFIHLDEMYGSNYFQQYRDHTKEKIAWLAKYGLSPQDPEADDFEWETDYRGNLIVKKKPDSIRPKGDSDFIRELQNKLLKNTPALRPRLNPDSFIDYEIGFVLNFANPRFLRFELDGALVREKKGKKDVKRLNIHKQENWGALQSLDTFFYSRIIKFSQPELSLWLSGQASKSFGSLTLNSIDYSDERDQQKLKKHYFALLKSLWQDLSKWGNVFYLKEGKFNNTNLLPAEIRTTPAKLQFTVSQDKKFLSIDVFLCVEGESESRITFLSQLVFAIENRLYLAESYELIETLSSFKNGVLKFPISDRAEVLKKVVMPLKQKHSVILDESLELEEVRVSPEPRVTLSELNEEYLLLKPQFKYENTLLDYDDLSDFVTEGDDVNLRLIHRDKEQEKSLYELLRDLHPKFAGQRNNLYYYLPFNEVMKDGWYLKMSARLKEVGIPVYGTQDLKHFKYNTNSPKVRIGASSGIDWFDLQISVEWGDLSVPLRELRQAILNKQTSILLDDGSLGMIPEEWLKQYTLLLRMGTEENGSLKVSKMHFSLLDELAEQLDNNDVLAEIEEKKKRLVQVGKVKTTKPSKEIKATLRPYQLAGFQWMQTLNSIGWGGCLADDMGLGKTLQTITFLQYLKEKNKGSTQLVICPTSLIFNWENEIKKFCPSLKYHTYYGTQRSFDNEHFENFDVILTSYGVLRLDLKHLTRFKWDYVILDESQAIKNPKAQITKAVQLLPCNNRLILSGTPVQNNTGDLYAQFNFVNPGLLGNWEFFKREFANDIDKSGDKEKMLQLRKLIYPFLLRRTKEQVAKDLPDKTEMTIWCNMSTGQRKVYDEYKNYYRHKLLEKIDEEGLGKAGIYVLEGLLKLRQICDHPALVKDKEIKSVASVKGEELLREIQENTGDHKLLIFSQFTEMLKLIEQDLKNNDIRYCYLDGSTPTPARQKQVEEFQTNPAVKIFLISLKAGGVGLNLTAADYVYLVDPWWNPAAEQQAIDRTHRIGQTKKIFAYKMICKDTIEEKILNLQEKKKNLSGDLVSEDAAFVKKLTRDDIEFLFT